MYTRKLIGRTRILETLTKLPINFTFKQTYFAQILFLVRSLLQHAAGKKLLSAVCELALASAELGATITVEKM